MIDSGSTLLIGVDGGGTGCRAAIGTVADGILAHAESGPANATSDPVLAIKNITLAVTAAAQVLGISIGALRAATTHVGLAGIMNKQDVERVKSGLHYGDVSVTDDRPTAVKGALGDEFGFVLSVGTGTIAASYTSDGLKCVGGWGFQLSDRGSGAWLGRAALENVLLCYDGIGEHSPLTRNLLSKFNSDPNQIVAFGSKATAADLAKLARDIVERANSGDPWGRVMMQTGAEHLVHALNGFGFVTGNRLCLTGGVGPHYAKYLPDEFLAGYTAPLGTALDGAFALAQAKSALSKGTP
jgi:glucosamine kinase